MEKINHSDDEMEAYYAEVRKYPLLSGDEEKMLATQIALGDAKAKEKLVNSNLRLALKIARGYARNMGSHLTGTGFKDLVQEGNLGLLIAAGKYNPQYNVKFSTYAAYWINQRILRELTHRNRTIRLPIAVIRKISRYNKVVEELTAKYSRQPTNDEIANTMGIQAKELNLIQTSLQEISSLDRVIESTDEQTIADTVPDEKTSAIPEEVEDKILMEDLESQIAQTLTDRERKVMCGRLAINRDQVRKSLKEISEEINVSREGVRQIEDRSIRKLRNINILRDLKNNIEKHY